jgi:hypothetical protein
MALEHYHKLLAVQQLGAGNTNKMWVFQVFSVQFSARAAWTRIIKREMAEVWTG